MADEKKASAKPEKSSKPAKSPTPRQISQRQKAKKNPFKSIGSFFKSVKSEGKKSFGQTVRMCSKTP